MKRLFLFFALAFVGLTVQAQISVTQDGNYFIIYNGSDSIGVPVDVCKIQTYNDKIRIIDQRNGERLINASPSEFTTPSGNISTVFNKLVNHVIGSGSGDFYQREEMT